MESTANVIVESISLMDSTTPSDPKTELMIEITPVEAMISTENDESSLPKPNEIKQASSSATDSDVKENERKTWTLPESNSVHEEEAPVRPTHGVLQRTSWLSCCGLFDVVT
ncbi:BnaA03g48470D [Brassica napus]|uniref:BnaA03g48470D protein n=2 Tax=Brassica napus TaxID=3708 RepID=A0A078I9Y3_BRANA|nr:BnaA03g48470D [Brassica napus]